MTWKTSPQRFKKMRFMVMSFDRRNRSPDVIVTMEAKRGDVLALVEGLNSLVLTVMPQIGTARPNGLDIGFGLLSQTAVVALVTNALAASIRPARTRRRVPRTTRVRAD